MSTVVAAPVTHSGALGLFDQVDGMFSQILDVEWESVGHADLVAAAKRVERLSRALAAANGEILGAVQAREAWKDAGAKDLRGFIQGVTGGSSQRVTRDLRLAEMSDPEDGIPAARQALRAGEISQEHVTTITEFANTAGLKYQLRDPDTGGQYLVDLAKELPVGQFRKETHAWRNSFDPGRADADAKQVHLDEWLEITPDPRNPGQSTIRGRVSAVTGTLSDEVLSAIMGRRPLGDERKPSVRRAQGWKDAMHILTSGTGPTGAGGARSGVNLVVTVPMAYLEGHVMAAGSASLPDPADFAPDSVLDADVNTSLESDEYPGRRDADRCIGVDDGAGVNTKNGAGEDARSARFFPSSGMPPLRLPSGATLTATGGPRVPVPDPELVNSSDPVTVAKSRAETQRLLDRVRAYRPGDPHVISTAIAHEVLSGLSPPRLADGVPLAPWEFARLACDAQLSRVVFGPTGIILDAGRSRRLFSEAQARAIIARDTHCVWPGCHAPPKYCEIHHSLHWGKHQGDTNAEQGALVCFHHHDVIHRDEVSMVRFDGKWYSYAAGGEPITEDSHGSDPGRALEAGPPEAWLRPSQREDRLANAPDFVPKPGDDDHHG